MRTEYADSLAATKGVTAALDSFAEYVAETEKLRPNGFLIHAYCQMVNYYIHLGDIERARAAHAKAESVFKILARRPQSAVSLPGWSRQIENTRGFLLRREGRLDQEERPYLAAVRQAEEQVSSLDARGDAGKWVPPASRPEGSVDSARIFLAQTWTAQERLDEAELLLREALKRSLARDGRNSTLVGRALSALRVVFINRGRYAEALVLAEWADKTLAESGISERSSARLNARIGLVNSLSAVGLHREAADLTDAIRGTLTDDSRLEEAFSPGYAQLDSLIHRGRTRCRCVA